MRIEVTHEPYGLRVTSEPPAPDDAGLCDEVYVTVDGLHTLTVAFTGFKDGASGYSIFLDSPAPNAHDADRPADEVFAYYLDTDWMEVNPEMLKEEDRR